MSKKLFLVDIDLNGNQLKNCAVENLTIAPESPVKGQTYFDTTDNKFKYWNGTAWIAGAEVSMENMSEDQEGAIYGIYDSQSGDTFKFRVLKTVDERLKMDMSDGIISLSLNMKFKSAMPNDLTVPTAIGGVAAGTTAEQLKAKTVDQVLDDILFPELNPTVTAPSASISLKSPFSNNQILEVGANAPQAGDITTGFNQGSGTVAGQPTKKRAGALVSKSSFVYYGGNESTKDLPVKVALGQMSYAYKASYSQGETLVTSKGNTATHDSKGSTIQNPLQAGSVKSGSVQVFGTYPYFCNGATASSSAQDNNLPNNVTPDTKLPLQRWTDTLVGAKFASEAKTGTRLEFYFPSTKQVTKVEFMNTVSGKWENFAGYVTEDAGTKQVQGTGVAYTKLTTNGSLSGALQLRFTLGNK